MRSPWQRSVAALAAAPALLGAGPLASSPELGQAEGRCRSGETGPALMVDVIGLKDRQGLLKLEVYPANDTDFLQDDNILINAHKVFRRVEERTPGGPSVSLCVRVPGPGPYSVVLLHDRDSNRKFGWMTDGVGFASNPRLGWGKPKAAAARVIAGTGMTRVRIILNYHRGLGMSPLPATERGR